MSNKEFVSYDYIRDNAIRLARRIYQEGFVPDVIYVSLRGGAYMGNVISEYFKLVPRERPVFYAAVVARSYTNIHAHHEVYVDGWTYSPEYLRNGDRVLFVDDIFDTGRTVNHLVQVVLEKGIPRQDVKVAVHDYKVRHYESQVLPITPDYYCRRHDVASAAEDSWIHYLSHEVVGLTKAEVAENYAEPDVRTALSDLL